MQTFQLHAIGNGFIVTNGDVANALQVDSLSDLLRLRQRLSLYLDNQQADPLPVDSPLLAPEWIDTATARKIAEELGYGPLIATTLRSACEAGHLPGARKRSKSGRAKTEGGGQWEFPRWALLQWLVERKEAHDSR